MVTSKFIAIALVKLYLELSLSEMYSELVKYIFLTCIITIINRIVAINNLTYSTKHEFRPTVDCRNVSYYITHFDQELRLDYTIPHPISRDKVVAFPTPYIKPSQLASVDKDAIPRHLRVLFSKQRRAFYWSKDSSELKLDMRGRRIDAVDRFVVDGWPIWFRLKIENDTDSYVLRMKCRYTTIEKLKPIQVTSGFAWRRFRLHGKLPGSTLLGGIDAANDNRHPYLIGITTYQNKTYLVKVVQRSRWVHAVLDNLVPTYISSAREVSVLTGPVGDPGLVWQQTFIEDIKEEPGLHYIYRCMFLNMHWVTGFWKACTLEIDVLEYNGKPVTWSELK